MKKLLTILFVIGELFCRAQTICNSAGNLMLFTNYDGGTLTINVDQNIPNLKIGICSYEACVVSLSGAFINNVTEVRYAGFNSANNSNCGSPVIPTTTIIGAPGGATTSLVFAPTATVVNNNGYGSIICGYSCNNNTSQGGCNTVDQIEGYFLGYFSGSTLFAHKVQYGCWTGTQSVSVGGNCCPPPTVFPGVISSSQTICAGAIAAPLTSVSSATVSSGTLVYQWQSSTTSTNSGFANISGANSTTYSPPVLNQTTYFRRAASTVTNNVSYSNVLTVNTLTLPIVSISGQTTVCVGSSATLSANGGTSYVWNQGVGTGSSVVITPTLATMLTVTCFPANGCSVVATQVILVINQPPITQPVTMTNVCVGKTATLSASGGTAYTWQPGNLSGPSITLTATSSQIYSVTINHSNGCATIHTISLNVKPLPVIAVNSNTSVCSGHTLSIITSTGVSQSTLWKPPLIPATPPVANVYLAPPSSLVYTLVANQAGCQDSIFVPLTVLPSPTVALNSNKSKICSGESAILTASGAVSYSWLVAGFPNSTPSIVVAPNGITTYSVIGTGTNGCTHQALKTITVSACTAIEDQLLSGEQEIILYPNPTNGEFYIQGVGAASFYIINSSGQLVRQVELNGKNNYKVSVSDFSPGIYFVISVSDSYKTSFRQKIIITKE